VKYLCGFDGIHDILQAASAFQDSKGDKMHHPVGDDAVTGIEGQVHVSINYITIIKVLITTNLLLIIIIIILELMYTCSSISMK